MGNCIDVQKPVLWADDEGCESPSEEEHESPTRRRVMEHYKTPAKEKGDGMSMGGSMEVATEIKIKISKKQLKELLRRVEEEGLPLDKLLADLVVIGDQICLDSSKRSDDDHHWRPDLQSIPEISE